MSAAVAAGRARVAASFLLFLLSMLSAGRASASDGTCGACRFFRNNVTGALARSPVAGRCECFVLYLANRCIASIPDGIFEGLFNTTSLVLSNNELSHGVLGDGAFIGLTGLQDLLLTGNALTALPEAILEPVRHTLVKLGLASNRLSSMPAASFPVLEEMDLTSNSITDAAADLGLRCPRLRKLSLAANQLTTLPAYAFANLSTLEKLNLSSNAIAQLPSAILQGSGQSLTDLDISDNKISTLLPRAFAGLSALETIYLDHNEIQTLSAGAFSDINAKLRLRIYLSSNQISHLSPGAFNRVGDLNLLDLSWNRIRTIDSDALSGPAFKRVEFLHLTENQIEILPDSVFRSLAECNTLMLGGNRLTEVSAELFKGMVQLRTLSLGNNRIAQLHAGAFDTMSLSSGGTKERKKIILAKNRLKSMPAGLFKPFKMPIVLILGDNPFERVGGVSPLADLSTISSLAILDAHNLDPTLLSGISTKWPLANAASGHPDCNQCHFSRHINGTLCRDETRVGACSKCTAVEIQDAYVRYVPAGAFRGMKALTNVNLGVVGIEALVEDSFAADLLPGLERMQMIISSELGISAMACLPNISETQRLDISIGMPVGRTAKSAGPPLLIGICPSTCTSGTFYDTRGHVCLPCGKGSFSAGVGASRCSLCSPATYMSEHGAASCMSCPKFATSPINSTGIFDCRCISNYQSKKTPGQSLECTPSTATTSPSPSHPDVVLDPGSMNYAVKMVLLLPYPAAVFDTGKQDALRSSLAAVVAVSIDSVSIDKIEAVRVSGRRLLAMDSIRVSVSIKARSQAEAQDMVGKLSVDNINAELKSKGLLQAKFFESPGVYDAEARPYVVSVDDAREVAANHRILIVICSTVGTVLTTACLTVLFLRHYCPLGDAADDGDEESPGCNDALEHMSQGSSEVIDITNESRGYVTPAEQGDAVVRVNFSPDCPGLVEPGTEPETRLEPVSFAHTTDGMDVEMSSREDIVLDNSALPAPSKQSLHGIRLEPLESRTVNEAIRHAQEEDQRAKDAMRLGLSTQVEATVDLATHQQAKARQALNDAQEALSPACPVPPSSEDRSGLASAPTNTELHSADESTPEKASIQDVMMASAEGECAAQQHNLEHNLELQEPVSGHSRETRPTSPSTERQSAVTCAQGVAHESVDQGEEPCSGGGALPLVGDAEVGDTLRSHVTQKEGFGSGGEDRLGEVLVEREEGETPDAR